MSKASTGCGCGGQRVPGIGGATGLEFKECTCCGHGRYSAIDATATVRQAMAEVAEAGEKAARYQYDVATFNGYAAELLERPVMVGGPASDKAGGTLSWKPVGPRVDLPRKIVGVALHAAADGEPVTVRFGGQPAEPPVRPAVSDPDALRPDPNPCKCGGEAVLWTDNSLGTFATPVHFVRCMACGSKGPAFGLSGAHDLGPVLRNRATEGWNAGRREGLPLPTPPTVTISAPCTCARCTGPVYALLAGPCLGPPPVVLEPERVECAELDDYENGFRAVGRGVDGSPHPTRDGAIEAWRELVGPVST